ncbi:MAG: sensory transduction histidine kinase [Actinomycetia bacterium]|nr:sensory transduction histidine kinase [Actinomycetes bacterium]
MEPTGESRTAEQAELAEVRAQLREAQQTMEAIRSGGIDSLMIGPPGHEQVYALVSADRPYRLIVEAMNEGAATVSPRGVILNANPRLGAMSGQNTTDLVGTAVLDLIPDVHRPAFAALLDVGTGGSSRGEVDLTGPGGTAVPVLLAVSGFDLDGMLLRCLVLTDLTAQRAAEIEAAKAHEALREQNAFLEQAQESLGLGWWVLDAGREVMLTFSPEAHRIYGLSPAEFDGKMETLWSLAHPDDMRWVCDAFTAALQGGAPYQAEHRIVRPDGARRWILQSAVVQRDDTGTAKRVLGICQDITDRKRIGDEIRASAAYNRSLIEANLNPMITIGSDGMITDLNAATEQATGYGRAELLGTEFSGYFTEPDLARAGYEQAFRDGSARDYPLELRHRDGHITSVLYNAVVYRDPAGRVLGVMAAARDVTEANRIQAALRESEERLRVLFDNAPVGIEDVALSGDLVRVNPRFCQITGYTADELRSLRVQDITHPDDLDADLANLQRLRSGEIDSISMEKRDLRKDGGVVWVEANRALVRNLDGSPLLYVGTMRDITAQREAEAQVRALHAGLEARVQERTADLERSNKNLEAFTYSVSHDLRAPLRGLSGFSAALVEDYSDRLDETGRGYAERIQAAGERMATLIDDLLQLSRVSRTDMNLGPVDLSAEVADIAGELRASEPGRQVRFAIQDGVMVTADRSLIRTVVQNLVENAWKFTVRRDPATIEFGSTTAGNGQICCSVRDNGAGFDPAYADKLFQPFERLHEAADFPGTGIGLASVQRIIERHGGRVWAEGAVGRGATFSFTLDSADTP